MAETSIQWTDHSINPIRAKRIATGAVGHYCEKISPGCANCYASNLQKRFNMPAFGSGQRRGDVEIFLDSSKLQEVWKRKKPTKYFWCDMTDMFGHWVTDDMIDACFATMAMTPQHTHQILTKRPDRMRDYILGADGREFKVDGVGLPAFREPFDWPLPNVWAMTSVENQEQADKRIPELLQVPAKVRGLSVEPLLGPVDITAIRRTQAEGFMRPLDGRFNRIHWVIIGGESGNNARPCHIEWVRDLIRQCKAAGVACFVKQLGSVPYQCVGNGACVVDPAPCRKQPDGDCIFSTTDKKGGNIDEWSADLRVREFPA